MDSSSDAAASSDDDAHTRPRRGASPSSLKEHALYGVFADGDDSSDDEEAFQYLFGASGTARRCWIGGSGTPPPHGAEIDHHQTTQT